MPYPNLLELQEKTIHLPPYSDKLSIPDTIALPPIFVAIDWINSLLLVIYKLIFSIKMLISSC